MTAIVQPDSAEIPAPLQAQPIRPDEARVLDLIDENEVVELLQDLIRQRSDYPPGDTRAAVSVVAQKLAEAGIRL